MEVKTRKSIKNILFTQRTYTEGANGSVTQLFDSPVGSLGNVVPGYSIQLASRDKQGKWKVDNLQKLTEFYNNANKTNLSEKEVNRIFYLDIATVANNDAANILNTNSNYSSQRAAVTQRKSYAESGIPKVIDPTTGGSTNSKGEKTTAPITAPPPAAEPEPTAGDSLKPQPPGSPTDTGTTGTGSSGTGSSEGSSDNKGAQRNEFPGANNNNGQGNINSTGNGAPLLLRYPLSNLDEVGRELGISYDFIKIQVKEYSQSLDPSIFQGETYQDDVSRYLTDKSPGGKGNAIATIILPMMQTMSTSNSVDWGADRANIFQLVGGAMAVNFFGRVGNEGVNPQLLKDTFNKLVGAGGAFAKGSVQEKNAITGILAGYLVGAPNIATRATGKVINPNMEMLFSGPRLRTFNFQFDMTPRNKDESKQIRRIIKTFKKYMSPSKSITGAFLQSPKIFELEYIYNGNIQSGSVNGNQHPYLNKFKACALTEFNVNFTPDGSYMTYRDDGSMTKYSITMSFSEISPIFAADYDDKDDMGF